MPSQDKTLNYLLKLIGSDTLDNIENYIEEVKLRDFKQFNNVEEVMNFFMPILTHIYENNTLNDIESLRTYSGISYNKINAILRNTWDYYKNGKLEPNDRLKAYSTANNISKIIENEPSLDLDIKTYRGVTLTAFKNYGITSLNELVNLKGEYYYEQGFTSTSLLRDKSFFNHKLEWHSDCNIEIEVLIPSESQDGIPLLTKELSYSENQAEYLLNKGTLLKIIDVKIDEKSNTAYLQTILVPQRIWNFEMQPSKNNKVI